MSNPARAIIDLGALRSNYELACSLAPSSRTLAVIKANAYGHGAVTCARTLEETVPAFGVCCMEEAMELREAGIRKPILLLRASFSADELDAAAEHGLWLSAYEEAHVEALAGRPGHEPLTAWLKIDTGMHRLGIRPELVNAMIQRLLDSGKVRPPIVLATHFAAADDPANSFTDEQIDRFRTATRDAGMPVSMANSAGLVAWPGSRAEWNRPGIMLYGASPLSTPHEVEDRLRPVMQLESRVIALRRIEAGETVGYTRNWRATQPSVIATVAIGYADGYPRHAPNGTPVLVNGHRARLAGRVSMDMISVDVTDIPETRLGDPVVLWGRGLPVNEVAA
ncbi:MAG: alanine racemase, partial [Xanthomonadales bacterium]|nr:alanine racemase [Xanthomonadales bacterium]NIX11832.1 alanine racemase [Xanthomonadales bacterium]